MLTLTLACWTALIIAFSTTCVHSQREKDCLIRLPRKTSRHDPLVMEEEAYYSASSAPSMLVSNSTAQWLYPKLLKKDDNHLTLILDNTARWMLLCLDRGNELLLTKASSGVLTCDSGQLYLDDWEVDWEDCGCRRRSRAHVHRGKTSCGASEFPEAKVHAISWKLSENVLVPQITVCFDPVKETTLYVVHRIIGDSLKSRVTDRKRPGFKRSRVFRSKAHQWYTMTAQRQSIGSRFGLPISSAGAMFLSRGHLAPDGDFSLLAEQDATYYYSNVLPKWQNVNNGNWKALESAVRTLASSGRTGRRLLVYTGALPQPLQLRDRSGDLRDVMLDAKDNKIPVPAVIWKAIYDPALHKAVAVLVLNSFSGNQEGDSLVSELSKAARNVCSDLPWVDWDTADHRAGYTFCWRTEDLVRLLSYAPDGIDTFDLLRP